MSTLAKITRIYKNTSFSINTHYLLWDAVFPEKKNPGGHGDTVEKGLGPRPLGPIGPIFRRTITVTGKVQFLEGP